MPQRKHTARKFGVELEFISSRDLVGTGTFLSTNGVPVIHSGSWDTRRWTVKSDGSLSSTPSRQNRIEIAGPPMTDLAELKRVCGLLNTKENQANASCGLHVHFDAGDLRHREWVRLIIAYGVFEDAIDLVVAAPRRKNNSSFAQSIYSAFPGGFKSMRAAVNEARDLQSLARGIFHNGRYWKVNLNAFWRHGTVEFRQHHGALDPEVITAWVELLDSVILYARGKAPIPDKRITTIDDMMAEIERGLAADMAPDVNIFEEVNRRRRWRRTRDARAIALKAFAKPTKNTDELRELASAGRVPWRAVQTQIRAIRKVIETQGLPDVDLLLERLRRSAKAAGT